MDQPLPTMSRLWTIRVKLSCIDPYDEQERLLPRLHEFMKNCHPTQFAIAK